VQLGLDEGAASPSRGWLAALLAAPGWVWIALLGWGLVGVGLIAWVVAALWVVLPYDEAFLGLSRAEINALNPHLLPFMAHDRVTFAGILISLGALYAQLARHGMKAGEPWARRVVLVSGGIGFATLFLFLGFGYFDPLHGLATLVLFVLFLLGLRRQPGTAGQGPAPASWGLDWRGSQWGQRVFVLIGAGLFVAGAVVAGIGVTQVFVPEDLAFLQTTPAALQAANPRLIPLVAHDRAGMGGAAAADGLALLLTALWGFRAGARWLWWTLLAVGLPAFGAALGVHAAVGYTDTWHLAPAVAAALAYGMALLLAYSCLMRAPVPNRAQSASRS
jgi:dihydroorotate dehydrogenase